MDPFQNPYMALPGVTPEEITFLQQATSGLTDNQNKYFYMVYTGKRKSGQDLLLFTLIGFLGVAGIQRFITGQIGMGILYLLTGGLCFIGTIVDLLNNKSLASEYNKKAAYESFQIAKMSS